MMSTRSLSFALFLWFVTMFPGSALCQDEPGGAEEKDWLEYYYQEPTPGRFVDQMKSWAEDGTLDNEYAVPALIAFISQVIRQNKAELAGWYDSLAGLDPKHRQILHTGMLFSRTEEADELLRERYGERYDEQKEETPRILELPLDKRSTLDMLWGFFYATGSEGAIRRIVLCMRFAEAPDELEGIDIPEGYRPLYTELPYAAVNMLIANGIRHPRVFEICKKLYREDDSLIPVEKFLLYEVLSDLDPVEFPPEDSPQPARAAPEPAGEEEDEEE